MRDHIQRFQFLNGTLWKVIIDCNKNEFTRDT